MFPIHVLTEGDLSIIIDTDRPHWFAGNEKARLLFEKFSEGATEAELVQWYHARFNADLAKSFIYTRNFLDHLKRIDFCERTKTSPYTGRFDFLHLDQLKELWLHTNNSCNLACKHCLVNSSPKEDPGPDTKVLKEWIQTGIQNGVERFYFTGGEPFYRPDILELIREITVVHGLELIIISNGMLFDDKILQGFSEIPPELLKLQVSLDGATAKTNDAIRGRGSFHGALEGLDKLSQFKFEKAVTTVIHPKNMAELNQIPKLAHEHGVDSIHLMWPHLRGRFRKESEWKNQVNNLQGVVEEILEEAKKLNIFIDNYESIKWKINGKPGVKFDLAGAGWESLCIYSDGNIYPSAAFANHQPLNCGSLEDASLDEIWRNSEVLQKIRKSSLIQNEWLHRDPYKYFVGGGDIEHAYFFSSNGTQGQFTALDPYYPLYRYFAERAFLEIGRNRRNQAEVKNGFDGPHIYHAMGEGSIDTVPEAQEVATLHSNCVLGFGVEKPRQQVQDFYGDAAEDPKEELCCPITFDPQEIKHIPQAVIDRFYGCGSPVLAAQINPGEVFLDLGSGAGIDCFIAAKKVGKKGKVIGVDMTDRMLEEAHKNRPIVAKNLGYDVVEFREGFLENIPVEVKTIDIITSNCVINLSPDKKAVFSSMWKCLKNGGRIVISDIIAGNEVPVAMRLNPILWGECLSGSLTQDELFAFLEETGFYAIEALEKRFWREVEGCEFYSLTFRAFKYEKQDGCKFIGQKAVYRGPFKGVTDEEGHYFPRNIEVEICTDTYHKLSVGPLKQSFNLISPEGVEQFEMIPDSSPYCAPKSTCC